MKREHREHTSAFKTEVVLEALFTLTQARMAKSYTENAKTLLTITTNEEPIHSSAKSRRHRFTKGPHRNEQNT